MRLCFFFQWCWSFLLTCWRGRCRVSTRDRAAGGARWCRRSRPRPTWADSRSKSWVEHVSSRLFFSFGSWKIIQDFALVKVIEEQEHNRNQSGSYLFVCFFFWFQWLFNELSEWKRRRLWPVAAKRWTSSLGSSRSEMIENERKWAKLSSSEDEKKEKKRKESAHKEQRNPKRWQVPPIRVSGVELPDNKSMALSLFRWIWQGEAIGHSAIPLRWLRGSTASSLLVATVFFPNFLLAPLIFGSGAGLRRLQRQ